MAMYIKSLRVPLHKILKVSSLLNLRISTFQYSGFIVIALIKMLVFRIFLLPLNKTNLTQIWKGNTWGPVPNQRTKNTDTVPM